MNDTRSYSCLERRSHFDCNPFWSTSSTSVVQLLSIQLHHQPHAMMKSQFFKKKLLKKFVQMSHMKTEPGPDAEKPPDELNICQKQENEDDDDDLFDQMTESPPDLEDVEECPMQTETEPQPEKEQEQVPMVQIPILEPDRNRHNEIRHDRRSSKDQNVRQKDSDKDPSHKKNEHRSNHSQDKSRENILPQVNGKKSEIGRIKNRRQTMVNLIERPNTPTSITAHRKRRQSVSFDANQSQKDKEIVTNKAKKMKISSNPMEKQSSTTTVTESSHVSESTSVTAQKLKITIDAKDKQSTTSTVDESSAISDSISVNSNSSVQGKSTPTSTPSKSLIQNKLFSQKNRDKKFKDSATPPITQFFQQKSLPSFRCDTCVVRLKSQNEVNFHLRLHKKGRCTKCKEAIDNNSIESIHNHMISCLFLGNKLSKDCLAKFLKVKVDLRRLTPDKIDEIQKKLSSKLRRESSHCIGSKKPAPKSKQRERYERELKNKETSQTEQQSMEQQSMEQQSTEKLSISMDATKNGVEKCTETSTKKHSGSEARSTNDHTNDDKSSGKKSKNKKTPSKTKIVEKEANEDLIIEGNQSAALNWIDDTIKDKPFSLRNFENEKQIYLTIKEPMNDAIIPNKLALIIETIKNRQEHVKDTAVDVIQRPHTINLSMTTAPTESGSNRSTPNTPLNTAFQPSHQSSFSRSISSPHHNNVQLQMNVPSRMTPPIAVPLHNIPIAPKPSTPIAATLPNTINTHGSINTPTLPQLLSLPSRMPTRSRAVSVHMSQAEYSARLQPMRRQSVCDNQPGSSTQSTIISGANETNGQYSTLLPYTQQCGPPPQLQPPFITQVHNTLEPQKTTTPTTLKILTPDDLNSRAMNVSQSVPATPNPRIDSPNSTENNTNVNNSNNNTKRVLSKKRPRTKTTPMRTPTLASLPSIITDDDDISISVSLSRLGNDRSELILTYNDIRLNFDSLTTKRQNEVKSSLLKDNVWKKMLDFLKDIKPTQDTLDLFQKILPKPQYDIFITELRNVYGTH